MFSRVVADRVSSGRLAWLVAMGAVGLIVALPPAVSAQSYGDRASNERATGDRPSGTAPSLAKSGRPAAPAGPAARPRDLLDARDRFDDTVTQAPFEPLGVKTVNAIVCVAGCDSTNGKVVFQGASAPLPILASIDLQLEPVRKATGDAVLDPVTSNAAATAGTIVCLAGCYDGERRTFAATGPAGSIYDGQGRTYAAAPAPAKVRLANFAPRAVAAPANDVTPSARPRSLALKRAFSPHAGRKATRRHVRAVPSVLAAAPAPTSLAAVTPAKPVIDAAVPGTVSGSGSGPAIKPNFVTTVTPASPVDVAPKAAKRAVVPRNAASVSNDWFNRINRDRALAKAKSEQ